MCVSVIVCVCVHMSIAVYVCFVYICVNVVVCLFVSEYMSDGCVYVCVFTYMLWVYGSLD